MLKIIRYVIWTIINSKETSEDCLLLLQKEEFQAVFEIEINKFMTQLSIQTKQHLQETFDEIMNSPIVMSHAARYKEMLINDFNWKEEEILECYDEEIFKPKKYWYS